MLKQLWLKQFSKEMPYFECGRRDVASQRDPLGQRNIHFLPGDRERETYRLSTFHHYPRNTPIDPRQFAAHGFYYTGYRERIKCFSARPKVPARICCTIRYLFGCGQCKDNWSLGDDVTSDEWHTSHCDVINGRNTTNIPVSSFLRRNQPARNNEPPSSANLSNAPPVNHRQPTIIAPPTSDVLDETDPNIFSNRIFYSA